MKTKELIKRIALALCALFLASIIGYAINGLIRQSKLARITSSMVNYWQLGNVKLTERPCIDAKQLTSKGWSNAGNGYATVFSVSYTILQKGKEVTVHVTPILGTGRVLTPDELDTYVKKCLNGTDDILLLDYSLLGIVLYVNPRTELADNEAWDNGLHKIQNEYYALQGLNK